MRSVPLVLSWEMFRRGRYAIPTFVLIANLFPVLIYTVLREPVLPLDDYARLQMHIAFYPFITIILSVGVIIAQGRISRLYAAPLSTERLVLWHMTSGALLLALLVGASLSIQNLLFSLGQSVLGPACLALSLWSAGTGLIHLSRKGLFRTQLLATPVVVVLWWGFSRYGSWTKAPRAYWDTPSASELLVMAATIGLSYVLHLVLVRRDRRGDFGQNTGLAIWLERIPSLLRKINPIRLRHDANAQQALFWLIWSRRGLLSPCIVTAFAAFFAAFVVLQNAIPNTEAAVKASEMPDAYLVGGFVILGAVSLLSGLVIGSLKSNTSETRGSRSVADCVDTMRSEVISSFLATRPVRNQQLAAPVLKSAALSVFLSGLIFWIGFAIICSLQSLLRGSSLHSQLQNVLGADGRLLALLVLLSLAVPWLLMANTAVVMMTGRETKLSVWFTLILVMSIFTHAICSWALDSQPYLRFAEFVVTHVVNAGTALILWTLFRAFQCSLLSIRCLISGGATWIALVLGLPALINVPIPTPAWHLLIVASGLLVLPLAAAPLAVQWNRHR